MITNRSGLSLIEIVVTLGLISVVGLILGNIATMSGKITKRIQVMEETSEFDKYAGLLLKDNNICTANFLGTAIVPTLNVKQSIALNLREVNDDQTLGATIFATGSAITPKLTLQSAQYMLKKSIGGKRYLGEMAFSIKSTDSVIGGGEFIRSAPFFVKLDSTNKVLGCGEGVLTDINFAIDARPAYAFDCNAYAAANWSSKDDCLHDGRWHVVQNAPGPGMADLLTAINQGAEVAITITNAGGTQSTIYCAGAKIKGSYAFCFRSNHYAGSVIDTWPAGAVAPMGSFSGTNPKPSKDYGNIGALATIIRSDGIARGVGLIPSVELTESAPIMSAHGSSATSWITQSWIIRY